MAVAAGSVDVGRTTMLVPRTADETTLEARLDRAVESEMMLLSAVTVSALEMAVEAAPPVGVRPRVLKAVEPPACAAATGGETEQGQCQLMRIS